MDGSRQWVIDPRLVRPDHWMRYQLAARYASGRVLDAACGCGYGSKILMEAAQLVVGVDSSYEAIKWADEHFHGPYFIQGKIEDEPWSGKFETVVSFETIEHIQDPREALQALRRACVGTLLASVPNEERYPFDPAKYEKDESPHFRHYTPKGLENLLKESGFRVNEWFCQPNKTGSLEAGTDGMFLIAVAE